MGPPAGGSRDGAVVAEQHRGPAGEPGRGQAGPADDRGRRVDLHADQGWPRGQRRPAARSIRAEPEPGSTTRAGRMPVPAAQAIMLSMTGGGVNVCPRTRRRAGLRSAQKAAPSGSSPARIRSRAARQRRRSPGLRPAAPAARSRSAPDQPATRARPQRAGQGISAARPVICVWSRPACTAGRRPSLARPPPPDPAPASRPGRANWLGQAACGRSRSPARQTSPARPPGAEVLVAPLLGAQCAFRNLSGSGGSKDSTNSGEKM